MLVDTDRSFAVAGVELIGDLRIPDEARGIVVFAHGSGSGRHSPRNQYVAEQLQGRQLATLLADLLTEAEERIDQRTGELRFDIALLATRLTGLIDWLGAEPLTAALPIGLFGASTGAAAALVAAADRTDLVAAVVSRGGRPDLAGPALPNVTAPTLLIVGGNDPVVLDLNRAAANELRSPPPIEIVPNASHLFPEPGALQRVAELAGDWFVRHLVPSY